MESVQLYYVDDDGHSCSVSLSDVEYIRPGMTSKGVITTLIRLKDGKKIVLNEYLSITFSQN